IEFRRVALLSFALSSPAFGQYITGARDDKVARVDSVFRAFDRTDSPGCALGVYQDGAIRYARGYGMASLEHGVPLSPRSVLDVGPDRADLRRRHGRRPERHHSFSRA